MKKTTTTSFDIEELKKALTLLENMEYIEQPRPIRIRMSEDFLKSILEVTTVNKTIENKKIFYCAIPVKIDKRYKKIKYKFEYEKKVSK